ncbi:hypothetical protein OH76DRAFT_1357416, partial [Lentinus brumalis]
VSPTPIHEILRDPAILSSLLTHRKKPRRASSSSHTPRSLATPGEPRKKERDRDRERESDSASILTQVLAEEERQARHLKAVLRQTGARLEEELRRADLAETRARTAEIGVQDLGGRLAASEAGRHQAELDATRAQEECRRWQMQADAAEREARRLQAELARTERAKAEVEQAEREAREAARRAEQTLREWQAREQGREEVRRLEVRRRYSDGRDDGFEDGRAEGYEAGRQDGYEEGRDAGHEAGRTEGFNAGRLTGFEEGRMASYSEGYEAGYAKGRKEERARALEAFDRFIESEMPHHRRRGGGDGSQFDREDRTRRWVEATRKMRERDPSPSPQHIQAPQPVQGVREPSPAPKLVWLHRPLNHHREPPDAGRPLPLAPEQRA